MIELTETEKAEFLALAGRIRHECRRMARVHLWLCLGIGLQLGAVVHGFIQISRGSAPSLGVCAEVFVGFGVIWLAGKQRTAIAKVLREQHERLRSFNIRVHGIRGAAVPAWMLL